MNALEAVTWIAWGLCGLYAWHRCNEHLERSFRAMGYTEREVEAVMSRPGPDLLLVPVFVAGGPLAWATVEMIGRFGMVQDRGE